MTDPETPATADDVQADASQLGLPTPAIPEPTVFGDVPPQTSGYATWATSPTGTLFFWWDADHHDWHAWIPVPPDLSGYVKSSDTSHIPVPGSMVVEFWGSPPSYTLTRRVFWNQLDCQFLEPPSTFSYTDNVDVGMEVSQETGLSMELGVEQSGLSASLTATFNQTVTVSTQHSIERTWTAPGSPVNTTVVLWQLVEEYAALLGDGTLFPAVPRGTWTARLEADDGTADGAIWIPTARFTQPVNTFYLDVTSFP